MKRVEDIVDFLQDYFCKNHWRLNQEDSRALNRTISVLRDGQEVVPLKPRRADSDDDIQIDLDDSSLELITGVEQQDQHFNRQTKEGRREW